MVQMAVVAVMEIVEVDAVEFQEVSLDGSQASTD
tara:strand:+ start:1221 stop:1322 length:102 start_codon:yes stop_codon:yes gene_type:complete